MVKTPRTRHSGKVREPQTIDLDPKDVSEVDTAAGESSATAGPSPAEGEAPRDTLLDPHPVAAEPASPEATAVEPSAPEPSDVITEAGTAVHSEPEDRPAETTAEPSAAPFDAKPASPEDTPRAATTASSAFPDAAAKPARRAGGLGRIVAGVIGGVVALILAAILQFAGLLGVPGGASGGGDVQGQIDGLKAEIETVKSSVGAGSPGDPELASGLDAVRRDVAALQEALSAGAGGEAPALQALDQRVAEIESAVAALGSGTGSQDAEAVAALGERVAAIEALVRTAQEAADAAGTRIGTLEQSVSALTARVDSQAAQPKIALAIGAAALKSAVDRGAPFVAELETFAAIAPDAPEIASLRPHAETGVATREALRGEMEAAAAAMIAAADPTDPDAGYFERLLQSAESLVTVRPIGEVAGSGVPETVARMEVALESGDLGKALAEYETLPESSKAAGTAFADRLKARRDVETLVDQAIANAMKA